MVLISDIEIIPTANSPDGIFLNNELYQSWNLASYPFLSLQCGSEERIVQCHAGGANRRDQLVCHPGLLQTFHLPAEPLQLNLAFDPHAEKLKLGPVFAVLTVLKNNVFDGPLVPYCKELARYSEKKHVLFYVFTLKDWRRETVVGYMLRHNVWHRRELPKPDVIYNRIGQRHLEKLPATKKFIKNLHDKNIHFFNAHFLDKWQVHNQLSSHSELLPYLPETVLYEDRNSLEDMILRYEKIFVKPVDGSQGNQIFRIHKRPSHFELDYTTFNGEMGREFKDFDELYASIQSRLRRQPFIIQQGLSLLEHRQCPLDFRLLCNKGQTGEWKMTSGIARVSSENQFVSNLARGGTYHSIKDLLRETFPKKEADSVHHFLGELALEVAEAISLETEGSFGELGIDLALDQSGKPWIIEVNTKPSKDLDPERDATTIRPSAKAVIDYGMTLAGFAKL